MSGFVHLHVHSTYSLLDGLAHTEDLVRRAKELDMPALAITDHGVMYGAIEFYQKARQYGLKPIIGIEMYIAPRRMSDRDPEKDKSPSHIILLARNKTGYQNLLQIATAAQLEGFYYKPRVDKAYLREHAQGLIALTGCGSGEIPRLIRDGRLDKAREVAAWYRDTFGADGFYLELQKHEGLPEFEQINAGLVALSREMGIPLVATNDVHYVLPAQARAQEILLCIQTNTTINDPKRMSMGDESFYLKSPAEMAALFPEWPEALENSLRIAEACDLSLDFEGYHLPFFEVPEGYTAQSYLAHLCREGLERRYAVITPELEARLRYELDLIHQMGFDTYFLIVWDLVREARRRGIMVGPGRGSAAASLVSYCLDITQLDPLAHGLIFERFLNPGRVTMPDIDIDFPDDRRDELIQYTIEKYGQDKVAQIITFGTMGARAAIRDAGRALDLPLPEVDRVAKLIPFGPQVEIEDGLRQVPELKSLYESQDEDKSYIRELIDTARSLEGVARHASTHAAGIVIADAPLVNYTPLHRPTKGGAGVITQYPMEALEDIGLLKMDYLGLSTLTIIQRTLDLLREMRGIQLTPSDIPLDDPAIYELLSSGEVTGIFQVESAGMRRVLTSLRPSEFNDIVAVLSLYRPGPMEYIDTYVERKHGHQEVTYRHPKLEPILKETYGIIVFQEQVIRLMTDLAGYSASEADLVRRAVGKKKASELLQHRFSFVKGAVEHSGLSKEVAGAIFDDIEYFARYGFNKCLPGDVEIVDVATGRLVRIEEIFTSATPVGQVLTCDTGRLKLQVGHLTGVMNNGVKPVFRLTTALGRQIEATGNHPFYTFNGWRRLDRLQPGDRIAVPRRLPIEGNREWPEHWVIVLGHLLAEGNLCHPHSVYYYTQSREQLEDYVRAVEKFENVVCKVSLHKGTFSVYAKRIRRNEPPGVVSWLKELGLWRKNAREKEIPAEVFTLKNSQIALLLGRLWSGDGYVGLRADGVHAYYATASERLARQVQHLLLRLGIVSRLRQVDFPYRGGRRGYQVHVMGNEFIRQFAAVVSPHLLNPEQREACAHAREMVLQTAIGTKDTIPVEIKQLIRTEKAAAGITWHQLRGEAGVASREFAPATAPTKRGFPRETIARLAEYFDSDALRWYAGSDVYWDQVVNIEYAGEKPTYDLTIAGTHNFIANDILVHNSHAASYAVLTCQTAYLKAKYPVEYMAAMLSVERNNIDKVAVLIAECRRLGIEVLPPDVCRSGLDFVIEGGNIRFGLGAIKNVGEGPITAILEARQKGGPFKDIDDFCTRVDLSQVNRRALESLIKAGAMDSLGRREQLLEIMDRMIQKSNLEHRVSPQLDMFHLPAFANSGANIVLSTSLPDVPPIPRKELLRWEKELVGLYISAHPLQQVAANLEDTVTTFCGQIDESMADQRVVVAGMVTWVRPHITKNDKAMAFVQLEDLQGSIEVVVFPRVYEETRTLWETDKVLIVKGRVDVRGREPKIICESVQDYVISEVLAKDEAQPQGPFHLHITLNRSGDQERDIQRLGQVYDLLQQYKGEDRFSLYLADERQRVQLDFPNDTTGYCLELEQALVQMLGAGAVRVSQVAS